MSTRILYGKEFAAKIIVGENPASQVYVRNKHKLPAAAVCCRLSKNFGG